jgi:hypothetical protein
MFICKRQVTISNEEKSESLFAFTAKAFIESLSVALLIPDWLSYYLMEIYTYVLFHS